MFKKNLRSTAIHWNECTLVMALKNSTDREFLQESGSGWFAAKEQAVLARCRKNHRRRDLR
jgi:hypothetical protein